MSESALNDTPAVVVEFVTKPGLQQVSLSPVDLVEKSTYALDRAMQTIQHMAQRVTDTVDSCARRPSAIEVSFGLKFDVESGAIIAKVGGEASLNVKLTWDLKNEEKGARK